MQHFIDNQDVSEALEDQDFQRDRYLTFHLQGEDYGIPIRYVTEIIGIQKITEVSGLSPCIRGVINLRGRIFPVMDVRLRFGLPERDYDHRTCFIVVEMDGYTTGLVVDRVNEVAEIPAGQISAAPQHKDARSYIMGMGKLGNEVKILLDVRILIDLDTDLDPSVLSALVETAGGVEAGLAL